MRHRKTVKKLGRTASHRKAMLRNMASAIIEHRQIKTTFTKAKAVQGYIERLITYGKKDTVHSRRLAFKLLQNRTLVKNLFDEIAPTFSGRNGGYTRVIKLGQRQGDAASMAILQLVGFEKLVIDDGTSKKKSKPKKSRKPAAAAAAVSTATVVEDTAADETVVEDTETPAVEEADESTESTSKEEKKSKKSTPKEKSEPEEAAEEEKPETDDSKAEEGEKPAEDDEKKS